MLTSKTHTVVFIALREVIRSREKYIQTIEHLIESPHETIILGLGLLLSDRRDVIGLITSLRGTRRWFRSSRIEIWRETLDVAIAVDIGGGGRRRWIMSSPSLDRLLFREQRFRTTIRGARRGVLGVNIFDFDGRGRIRRGRLLKETMGWERRHVRWLRCRTDDGVGGEFGDTVGDTAVVSCHGG